LSRDILASHPGLRLRLFRAMFAIAAVAPLWLGRTAAYFIGFASWLADPAGRRTVRRNLAHFIPASCPEALYRTVRRNYINFALTMYESFCMHRLGPGAFAPPQVQLCDPWNIFARRPLPGPAIILTPHVHWEFLLCIFHRLKLYEAMEAIALSHGDPDIDALFERMRNNVGCSSLLLDRAPLASLRALRDGKILGVVGERDYTGTGIQVRFAGAAMSMPVGAAALAVQTQALVVPTLIARRGATRWLAVFAKPVRADPTLPKSEQVAALTQHFADTFARFIGAVPGQWVAFHDAWEKPGKS